MFDTLTIFRVVKTGFINYWRNIWLSAAATMVMTITLVIFSILALVFGIIQFSIGQVTSRVDISVYFKPGTAESTIEQFRDGLKKQPKIAEVNYTSAEEALADFKAAHARDQLILDSLDELSDNPLPATVQVKANKIEDYPTIADSIQNGGYKEHISKVNFEDNRLLIERFDKASRFIVVGGLVLVTIFSIIAILVIFNTITLTIYNRKEEVEIMRLVGATNWYIRGPFIIESLLYSVVATIITSGLALTLVSKLQSSSVGYIGNTGDGGLPLFFPYGQWTYLIPALLVIAVFLSVTSSMLAIRKYLKT